VSSIKDTVLFQPKAEEMKSIKVSKTKQKIANSKEHFPFQAKPNYDLLKQCDAVN
jgi:hypothetical protein